MKAGLWGLETGGKEYTMDYDDLNAFLAEDEKRLAEQEEEWNKQKEMLREQRAVAGAETVSVNADTVAWTGENIKNALEGKLNAAHADLIQVDVERERDKTDIFYRVLFLAGACLVYPVLMLIFSGMDSTFKMVLKYAYMLMGAVAVIWTLRELLNAITKYVVRGRKRADKLLVDGMKILTYNHEKILIEEQILRINRFIKEEQELEYRSECNGGLSDTDYERLKVLKYTDRDLYHGYTKEFTFMEYLRAIL
ncbi:MAG: hypothetical protein IKZ69_05610 [Lachnospiraceae bacterium]|nr:hypothetical protein [Lachnospiraceae bacterium]